MAAGRDLEPPPSTEANWGRGWIQWLWRFYEQVVDFMNDAPWEQRVAEGRVTGYTHINKFGLNTDIDTGTVPETLWDGGGLYVEPTQARLHDVASTSTEDAGSVLSSGTATGGSKTSLIDTSATFSSDGVAAGDVIINDTTKEHAVVVTVTSETVLTVDYTIHNGVLASPGDSYRVVNATGTGSSVVHLYGLDGDGYEVEEFVVMNGTTSVATSTSFLKMHRMHSDGAASDTGNVGTITATAQTDATVSAQINPNNGTTLMCVYCVPRGKEGYLTQWSVSLSRTSGTSDTTAQMELIVHPDGIHNKMGARIQDVVTLGSGGTSSMSRVFEPHLHLTQGTEVYIECTYASASNLLISGNFDIILKDIS
jgi:hypothetical protein